MKHKWKVVPICDYQKLDVRKEDLLNDGDFRKCDTYRGGGGYDQFPAIAEKRLGLRYHKQFIVQLYGCNLDCPYCYVTRSGVWGEPKEFTTGDLIRAFVDSQQEVFHLMGGAPAIYINDWYRILQAMPPNTVFHSDFLLTEQTYDEQTLAKIKDWDSGNQLYAVDIKGVTTADYERNTRKPFKPQLFWSNLEALVKHKINFYLTFTAPDPQHYDQFVLTLTERFGKEIMTDAFTIPLIEYDATPFVDVRPNKNDLVKIEGV